MFMLQRRKFSQYGKHETTLQNSIRKVLILNK